MQKNKIKNIKTAMENEIKKIRSYFSAINKQETLLKDLERRIKNELSARIKSLDETVRVTTISLLESDAINAIKEWKSIDKNRYYDAELSKCLSCQIRSEPFNHIPSHIVQHLFWGSSAFVGTVLFFISIFTSFATIPLFILFLILVGSFKFAIPRIIEPKVKENLLIELHNYLKEITASYLQQINNLSDEFYEKFNEIEKGDQ